MMSKTDITILPSDTDSVTLHVGAVDFNILLSEDCSDSLEDLKSLYDLISNPRVPIYDKFDYILRLQMYFSKSLLLEEGITSEDLFVYKTRRLVLEDLEGITRTLHEYSAGDTLDVGHPLFHKSVSFIIEALLMSAKEHLDNQQFDAIVRTVSIAMPGIENRIKKMVSDTSVEDILSLRSNPILEKYADEKRMLIEYLADREEFIKWKETVKGSK